jgi:hypothetical protein
VIDLLSVCFEKIPVVGETVRRERRWTSAGETPARELVRSVAAPIAFVWGDPFASGFRSAPQAPVYECDTRAVIILACSIDLSSRTFAIDLSGRS